MAHCLTFTQLAALYAIAKSKPSIVHQVTVLQSELVPESIRLPTASLSCLISNLYVGCHFAAGALDGTFMMHTEAFSICVSTVTNAFAIIVLGCVDARGVFKLTGRPG